MSAPREAGFLPVASTAVPPVPVRAAAIAGPLSNPCRRKKWIRGLLCNRPPFSAFRVLAGLALTPPPEEGAHSISL